jgi:hypothetical protein
MLLLVWAVSSSSAISADRIMQIAGINRVKCYKMDLNRPERLTVIVVGLGSRSVIGICGLGDMLMSICSWRVDCLVLGVVGRRCRI